MQVEGVKVSSILHSSFCILHSHHLPPPARLLLGVRRKHLPHASSAAPRGAGPPAARCPLARIGDGAAGSQPPIVSTSPFIEPQLLFQRVQRRSPRDGRPRPLVKSPAPLKFELVLDLPTICVRPPAPSAVATVHHDRHVDVAGLERRSSGHRRQPGTNSTSRPVLHVDLARPDPVDQAARPRGMAIGSPPASARP
jgi:hypothetical protein